MFPPTHYHYISVYYPLCTMALSFLPRTTTTLQYTPASWVEWSYFFLPCIITTPYYTPPPSLICLSANSHSIPAHCLPLTSCFFPGTTVILQSNSAHCVLLSLRFVPNTTIALQSTAAHCVLWPLCFLPGTSINLQFKTHHSYLWASCSFQALPYPL
jgi:hypothetical protein